MMDLESFIFRQPTKKDISEIWKFYNKVIKETEFLARIKPVSLKEEKKWVSDAIKKMKKKDAIFIVVENKGKIIGSASIERKFQDVHRHVGVFGIAILQEYTGRGIGKRLMEEIEKAATKMNIEIIELSVYDKNRIAQKLYRKMGFIRAGKIPRTIKRNGKYQDEIIMYKAIKSR